MLFYPIQFHCEDTWCPPLLETSTPTKTRFSTFLLIMHGILKPAVCLWWCKMLRSHYSKAWGDYFLNFHNYTVGNIITSGSPLKMYTQIFNDNISEAMCGIKALRMTRLQHVREMKSSAFINWELSFLRKGNCAPKTADMGHRSEVCCHIRDTFPISGE